MTFIDEEADFTQPALKDDGTRDIPLVKNSTPELKSFTAYGVVQFEPSKRWGAIQVQIDKGKLVSVRQFGHLEIEKEFAGSNLQKLLHYERVV